jgi:predicted lipid-binding transport protein (Tim44 family)
VDAIRAVDAQFSVQGFLEGAKGAFDWVLRAYKEGDVETLQTLLAPELFKEYQAALEEAKLAESYPETTLVSITDAQLIAADYDAAKHRARVTVRFLSEQIEVMRNQQKEIIAGDASTPLAVEDEWVFERDVKSRNPNWQIMDT